ncbi:50S ribosomal protein L15 [Patescibacteria group bacterium]|nr:50S ribosomal protein L15 [Patescibacteria group bacterium]
MLNTIKRTTENKKPKLVGRGSKRGKTSGRGTKGQRARAGHKIRPMIRDMIKKLPKLRGRGKNTNKAFAIKPSPVNVAQIERVFAAGASITPSALFEAGLVTRSKGRIPQVKILAGGEITKAVTIRECQVTDAAKIKIEAAGGTVLG